MNDPNEQEWTNPLTGHVIAVIPDNNNNVPMTDSPHVGSSASLNNPLEENLTPPEFNSTSVTMEYPDKVTELVDIINDSLDVGSTRAVEEEAEGILPPLEEMTIEQLTTTFSKKRAKYGNDADETIEVLLQLIKVHTNANDWNEAETYTKLYLEITKRKLGSAHADTLTIVRSLVDLQMKQQKHRVAAMSLKQVTKSHEELFGTKDQVTLDVKNKYADCLFKHGKIVEAQTLYQETLKCLLQLEADDEDLGYGLGPQKK